MGVSNFLSQVVQGATSGITGQTGVQDWKHASNVFVSGDLLRAPKFRGMFHVNFVFNERAYSDSRMTSFKEIYSPGQGNKSNILSVFTKGVDLPKFDIQYSTHNQYNKTTHTYKKMKYDPINITFHDDMSDYIWGLWAFYYAWYFADASKGYVGNVGNPRDNENIFADLIKSGIDLFKKDDGPLQEIEVTTSRLKDGWQWRISNSNPLYLPPNEWDSSWGLNGTAFHFLSGEANALHLLEAIEIFPLGNKKASVMILHNPKIIGWEHDNYDYSVNNQTATAKMQIVYEGVSYLDQVSAASVLENISYYDKHPSPLMSGSPRALLGPGGILDRSAGIIGNITKGQFGLSDVINAVGVVNAIKNNRLQSGITSELNNTVSNAARDAARNNFINKTFPGG